MRRVANVAVLASLLFVASTVSSAAATAPVLLKDINSTVTTGGGTAASYSWWPPSFTALGTSRVVFAADDGVNGIELWVTDGTAAGTGLIKDVKTGSQGSNPSSLCAYNGVVLYSAGTASDGYELWRTDGTDAGTYEIKNIAPQWNSSAPTGLTVVNGKVVFAADDFSHGSELWVTDGTSAGTSLLVDINPGSTASSPSNFVALSSNLVLFTANDGTHGVELWKTDGTVAGTALVKDITSGATGSSPTSFAVVGGYAYFSANDAVHGAELWRSDGTAAGTTLLADICPGATGSAIAQMVAGATRVFFVANDGTHGSELWTCSGATATLVKDLNPGATGGSISALYADGDRALFNGSDGTHGSSLWSSDGTSAGTAMAGSSLSTPAGMMRFGKTYYFSAFSTWPNVELWSWTPNGGIPSQVAEINPSTTAASAPRYLTAFTSGLYFFADDGTHGQEPWIVPATPPVVATAATITPSPVVGTTANVSVLGDSFLGESSLTYTWHTTGTPPASVSFSVNGTNSAKTAIATFTAAGSYTIACDIRDNAGRTTTSSVACTVNPTLTSVTISPASVSVVSPNTQQFAATGQDQFGATLSQQPTWTWTATGGTITSTGSFTAGNTAGTYSATATSGSISSSATITVLVNQAPVVSAGSNQTLALPSSATLNGTATDDGLPNNTLTVQWTKVSGPGTATFGNASAAATTATFSAAGSYTLRLTASDGVLSSSSDVVISVTGPPTVVTAPTATPNPVTGTTATLGILGGSYLGEAALTYTWRTTGTPPAAVQFDVNGTNAAKNASAVFAAAGSYALACDITDTASRTTSASLSLTVNATLTSVTISPASVSVLSPNTQQFSATGKDQFGTALAQQPTWTWTATGGSINTTGLFTAGNTGGAFHATATSGAITNTANVTVLINAAPVVSAGSNQTVGISTGATLAGSASDDGLPNGTLTLQWSKISGPGAVSFTSATTASTTASFTAAGSYTLRLTASDGLLSASSDATVTVQGSGPVTFDFTPTTASVTENDAAHPVVWATVTASAAPSSSISIPFTVDGTADAGRYVVDSSPLVFAQGQTTRTIGIRVLDDSLVNGDGTVVVQLGAPSAGTIGAGTFTLAIHDDDALALPTVSFASSGSAGIESDAQPGTVQVRLSRAATTPVSVAYAIVGGTATAGVDVTLPAGTLTFAPNQTVATVPLTVVDDQVAEADETVIIDLSSPVGATLGSLVEHTFTLIDDDGAIAPASTEAVLTPPGGTYLGPVSVTITGSPKGARAFYTAGVAPADPVPGASGTSEYATPVAIGSSQRISAVSAVRTAGSWSSSAVVHGDYTIIDASSYAISAGGITGSSLDSATSPACLEISGNFSSIQASATVTVAGQPLAAAAVQSLGDHHAYLDAPLSSAGLNDVAVSLRDAAGNVTTRHQSVVWTLTDLSGRTADERLVIRPGDSLLFTASGGGAVASIDGGLGGGALSARPGVGVAVAYAKPGHYVATAAIDGVHVGSVAVDVVTVTIPPQDTIAAEVGFPRPYVVPYNPPGIGADLTFTSADTDVLIVSTGTSSYDSAGLTLQPLKRGTPMFLARIGGAAGPIVRAKEVSEFTLEATYLHMGPAGPSMSAPVVIVMRPALDVSINGFQTASGSASISGDTAFTDLYDEHTGENVAVLSENIFSQTAVPVIPRPKIQQADAGAASQVTVCKSTPFEDSLHGVEFDVVPATTVVVAGADVDGDGLPDVAMPQTTLTVTITPPLNELGDYLFVTRPMSISDLHAGALANYPPGKDFGAYVGGDYVGQQPPITEVVGPTSLWSVDRTIYEKSHPVTESGYNYYLDFAIAGTDLAGLWAFEIYEDHTPFGTFQGFANQTLDVSSGTSSSHVSWDQNGQRTPSSPAGIVATAGANGLATVTVSFTSPWVPLSIAAQGASDQYVPASPDLGSEDFFVRPNPRIVHLPPGIYSFGPVGVTVTGSRADFEAISIVTDDAVTNFRAADVAAGITSLTSTSLNLAVTGSGSVDAWRSSVGVQVYRDAARTTPIFDPTGQLHSGPISDLGSFNIGVTENDSAELQFELRSGGTPTSRLTYVHNSFNDGALGPPHAADLTHSLIDGRMYLNDLRGNACLTIPINTYRTAVPGPDLIMTYNSADRSDYGYGGGWRTNYDMRLLALDAPYDGERVGQFDLVHALFIDEYGRWNPLFIGRMLGGYLGIAVSSGPSTARVYSSDEISVVDRNTNVQSSDGTMLPGERFCLTRHDGRLYYFDIDGYFVRAKTPDGHQVLIVRSADHKMVSVQDDLGRVNPFIAQLPTRPSGSDGIASLDLGESGHWSFAYSNGTMASVSLIGRQAQPGRMLMSDGSGTLVRQFTYDSQRRVTKVEFGPDQASLSLTVKYQGTGSGLAANVVCQVTGALGDITSIKRPTAWTGWDVIDPNGVEHGIQLRAENDDRITGLWMGPFAAPIDKTTIEYDGLGYPVRSVRVVDASRSAVTQTTWSPLGGTTEWANMPVMTQQTLEGVEGVDQEAGATSLVSSWSYVISGPATGLVSATRAADGALETTKFNADGLPAGRIDARGSDWSADRDRFGLSHATTSPQGRVSTALFDTQSGVPTASTTPYGYTTSGLLDDQRHAWKVTLPGGATIIDERDALGRPVSATDELSRTIEYTYDQLGRIARIHHIPATGEAGVTAALPDDTWDYQAEGSPTTVSWLVTHHCGTIQLSQQRLDLGGRLVDDIVLRTLVQGTSGTVAEPTHHVYNTTTGRLDSITDARGGVTRFTYDLAGNVLSTTSPEGVITSTTYNVLGWPMTATDGDGHVTSFTYDRAGRPVRTINAGGGWTLTGYDAAGQVVAQQAARGRAATTGYDLDGVLRTQRSRDGATQTIAVAGSGGSATITTTGSGYSDVARTVTLDGRGLASASATTVGGQSFATTMTRRDDGSLTSLTAPGRGPVGQRIDGFGRVAQTWSTAQVDGAVKTLTATTTWSPDTGLPGAQSGIAGDLAKPEIDPTTGEQDGVRSNALAPAADPTATDPTARVTARDAVGHVVGWVVFAGGGADRAMSFSQTFDLDGRVVTRTGPDQVVTTWYYDHAHLSSVQRAGSSTSFGYDALGRLTSVQGPDRDEAWTYDALGLLLSHRVGRDTTVYRYDDATLRVTDILGPGNQAQHRQYDDRGRLVSTSDALNRTTNLTYDGLDRVVARQMPDGTSESVAYDADRRDIASASQRGGKTVAYQRDPSGRVTSRSVTLGGTTTTATIDLATRPADPSAPGGAQNGFVTTTTYAGQAIARSTDRQGLEVLFSAPGQPDVASTYDLAGHLTARGTLSYGYDANGRLASVSAPGVAATSFTYDPVSGWLSTVSSAATGLIRTYARDGAGRIIGQTEQYGASRDVYTVARDGQGRAVRIDGPDAIVTYRYDAERLVRETHTALDQWPSWDALYAYDANANRTAEATYASPTVATASGDALIARLTPTTGAWTTSSGIATASGTPGAGAALNLASSGADLSVTVAVATPATGATGAGIGVAGTDGSLLRCLWQDRVHVVQAGEFDPPAIDGRLLVERVVSGVATPVAASTWTGDAATSHVLTVTQTPGHELWVNVDANAVAVDAAALPIDLLPSAAGRSLQVVNDAGGAAAAQFSALTWTTCTQRSTKTSSFDVLDRLSELTTTVDGQSPQVTQYLYDARGNLTSASGGGSVLTGSWSYDALDRQISATVGTVTTQRAYIGDTGMWSSVTTGGVASTFRWDGAELRSRTTSGATTTYLGAPGRPLLEIGGDGRAFAYAFEASGNIRGSVGYDSDANDTVLEAKMVYDAFGNRRETQRVAGGQYVLSEAPGFRYHSMWSDGNGSGTYQPQNRNYDPSVGRFMQADPARAGTNWYAYCGGDPVNRTDTTGLDWRYVADSPGVVPGTFWGENTTAGHWDYIDGTPKRVPKPFDNLTPADVGISGTDFTQADYDRGTGGPFENWWSHFEMASTLGGNIAYGPKGNRQILYVPPVDAALAVAGTAPLRAVERIVTEPINQIQDVARLAVLPSDQQVPLASEKGQEAQLWVNKGLGDAFTFKSVTVDAGGLAAGYAVPGLGRGLVRVTVSASEAVRAIVAELSSETSEAYTVTQPGFRPSLRAGGAFPRPSFNPGYTIRVPRGQVQNGYSSFNAFKAANGPASDYGEGYQWSHIVEQTDSNVSRFGATTVHRTTNLLPLPADINQEMNAIYSGRARAYGGPDGITVRDWLRTMSFDEQYAFGMRILRDLGVEVR